MKTPSKKIAGASRKEKSGLSGTQLARDTKAGRIVTGRHEKTHSVIAEFLHAPAKTPSTSQMVFKGDTRDVILKMRSGTPARTVPGIASNLGVSQDKLFELLRLPKSTMKGRISSDGMLSATEQDRVYRAEKVLARALDVLEDKDAAKAWVNRSNRSLGGEVPLALLDTEVGYELVLDTLGRIEYGVMS